MFSWNRLGCCGSARLASWHSSGSRRPSSRSGCPAPAPGRRRHPAARRRSASPAEDADAGAEPLLGMRTRAQDDLDQRGGVVADRGGFPQDPFVRPVAIAPVRTRHVVGHAWSADAAQAAQMGRDQLAAMEDLHRLGRDARLHFFAQQPERHRIEVLLDLDVVVEVDPAALPVGIFIRCRRQRPAARAGRAARRARAASCPSRASADRSAASTSSRIAWFSSASEKNRRLRSRARIQRCTTWTPTSTLALSRGLYGPRRDHRGAVMRRHVGIGAVDQRLVEAGPGDPGAQIVADDLARNAAHERQHVHVCSNPVRQRLRPGRLRKGVAGGAEHGDEDLGPAHLAGRAVDHFHGVAGEVDEHPLARRDAPGAASASADRPIRDTDRRTRSSRTRPGRPVPPRYSSHSSASVMFGRRNSRCTTAQSGTGRRSGATSGGGGYSSASSCASSSPSGSGQPSPARRARASVAVHRSLAQPQALRHRPLRQPLAQPQPQHLAYLPHRQSLARHSGPLLLGKGSALPMVEDCQQQRPTTPPHPR